MSIIATENRTLEIVNMGGVFITIFLIISIIVVLLCMNTKYWNKMVLDTIDICHNSLLLTFIAIVIFKIVFVAM